MKLTREMWDLHDLLREQYEVDRVYNKKAGVLAKDTFEKRKLALWVEVGELVNEWKDLFKFWSNKVIDKEKALEEYVDCLHFFLSLGNDLKVDLGHDLIAKHETPINQIFALSVGIVVIEDKKSFYEAFALFRGLGDYLHFTEQEVVAAYFKKNDKNELREDHILGGEKRIELNSVVLEYGNDLLWIGDNDGYEVGFEDSLVVGQYRLKDTEIYCYIDMESNKVLQAWELQEDHN